MPEPHIETHVLGDYQTNCFVVSVPSGRTCWIVDCGYEPTAMFDAIERRSLQPVAILLTHCHCDHIAGIDQALTRFGPMPIHAHSSETEFCGDPMLNLSGLLGAPVTATSPDRLLEDDGTLELEGTTWRVRHAPGHSPGSVLFVHAPSRQAIVGDTLFAGGMGRIDFPTSSADDMRMTLSDIMELPDDMTIHPGHGPATTIGHERATNPFLAMAM